MNVSKLMNMLTSWRIHMHKLLIAVLSVFALGLGMSFAQTDADVTEEGVTVEIEAQEGVDFDTSSYVGASFGYPLAFYYGLEDGFREGADLRFRASTFFVDFSIGADVLFDISQLEDNIQLYGGGGINLSSLFLGGGSFGVGLTGVLGGEYRFNRELGIFAELGGGVNIYPGGVLPIVPIPRGALGVNYHF